jgi:hypothetical protein
MPRTTKKTTKPAPKAATVVKTAPTAAEVAAERATATGRKYVAVTVDGNEFVIRKDLAGSTFAGTILEIAPHLAKFERTDPRGNPRRGKPLATHGGIAFEILRDVIDENGGTPVPFEAYAERLSDPNAYPGASDPIGVPEFFREIRHLDADVKRRSVIVTRNA